MRIPAGLTSTGMTTSTTVSPAPEGRGARTSTVGDDGPPAVVLMRPPRSTTAVDVLITTGAVAGLIAVAALAAAIMPTHPEPSVLLKGFGPKATWEMPAAAVISALGLTFLITAFIADQRAEEALRQVCREQRPGTDREQTGTHPTF